MKETQKVAGKKRSWETGRRLVVFGSVFLFSSFSTFAESFGPISVVPQSLSGETYHGYREYRLLVENQSRVDEHQISIVFPDVPYGSGNRISRISRTIVLGPGTRASVPVWQPPLQVQGNNTFKVIIDGQFAGRVNASGGMRHLSGGSRYSGQPTATFFVSRSLSYDDINNSFNPEHTGASLNYTARTATGAADSTGTRSIVATAWTPDPRDAGPHWIEVEFEPPLIAHEVRIYPTLRLLPGTEIRMKDAAGTNLAYAVVPPSTGGSPRRANAYREFTFPATAGPVKSVRIDFGSHPAGTISVDAVELVGPSGSAWAVEARASSEATVASYPGTSSSQQTREIIRAEAPVSEWSEYWLSYTPFDGIILSADEISMMPPALLETLWRYAQSGGNLFFFGNVQVPEPWRSWPATPLADGRQFKIGFGNCFVFDNANSAKLQTSTIKTIFSEVYGAARLWQNLPDESGANRAFPVIENAKVPIRSTVLIMLVFVLLIGPANLVFLSRLQRRTWLLWTIPAISFVTCLLVFAYSLLREGVTPTVRIEGITVLDQANRRAASVGITAFYCPLTPSSGLLFGMETEATPLVEMWDYGGGTRREVDWTQSQRFTRGWVTARVPAHFVLRKAESRRERLQVQSANGRLNVVNGLGANIQRLWLADAAGNVFTSGEIAAGQSAALTATELPRRTSGAPGLRNFIESGGYMQTETIATNVLNQLPPNCYIAELDDNPFFENGLGPAAKSARTKARALVFGILEPPQP